MLLRFLASLLAPTVRDTVFLVREQPPTGHASVRGGVRHQLLLADPVLGQVGQIPLVRGLGKRSFLEDDRPRWEALGKSETVSPTLYLGQRSISSWPYKPNSAFH